MKLQRIHHFTTDQLDTTLLGRHLSALEKLAGENGFIPPSTPHNDFLPCILQVLVEKGWYRNNLVNEDGWIMKTKNEIWKIFEKVRMWLKGQST